MSIGTTDAFGSGNQAIGPDGVDYSKAPQTTLKIVKWLRGSGTRDRVTLHYGWLTSCGPEGPVSAVKGRVGERFVLFSNDPEWKSENVFSFGYGEATSYNVHEALKPTH
ncbi:MAG TPA: hypothetical protein VF079_01535 [Sphingomicrobium sp.]